MFDDYKTKDSVVIVYTGEGKGKTSASLGLMGRALGAGWKIAYIQFIKSWKVNEHEFISTIQPVYKNKIYFYKAFCTLIIFVQTQALTCHHNNQQEAYDAAASQASHNRLKKTICSY